MNKLIINLSILFLTLAIVPAAGAADIKGSVSASEAAAPRANFSETKYSFGNVKKGKVISHDFTLINEGNAVLKIADLIPA